MSEKYQNRNSNHINRKRIKIISQTANEIIADIERADEVIDGKNGTPINASVFLDLINTAAAASQGSKVTVGGPNNYVSTFDADTKADVTTPIISKVNYNATTDTFMF